MKRYLCIVADVLTLSRICPFACLLVIFTVMGVPPIWALVVTAAGELTDAFDGPAAGKWPYSEHLEKRLWWRRYKVGFDMAADMILGAAALLYIAFHTYPFGMTMLKGAFVIGVPLQAIVVFWLVPNYPKLARKVIMVRRKFVYVPMIAVSIVMLLLAATVGTEAELTWELVRQTEEFWVWLGIGVVTGILLAIYKLDRLQEVLRGENRKG